MPGLRHDDAVRRGHERQAPAQRDLPGTDFLTRKLIKGLYIKFEIHIFGPSPFLIYIFSPKKIYYNEGVYTFYTMGKNMHFPTFFHPLSINFFPQNVILPYFCQTEKHTPLPEIKKHKRKLKIIS